MIIENPYNTKVVIARIDENKIPSVQKIMNEHPRVRRVLKEKGIYLYAEDVTAFTEHYNDEIILRISVSIGDIEQDCFDVGYYGYSKDTTMEEIANKVCKEKFFGFTCERMINNYAPIHLKMPAPCEEVLKTEYQSTEEEKVDITYICESMCHSIMRKLWKYSRREVKSDENLNELVDAIGLTGDEFHALMNEYL